MSRKLNAHEQKLYQAALSDPSKTLTTKEVEALIPDNAVRMNTINFLLGTGLLKPLKDAKGQLSFRAVQKKELELKKDLTDEESLVLSYIQSAGNEGIWTKHLKAKTELHQTVIDRSLKSLTQKQLIKAVKSVKFPTRKIYMLSHLEPSVEMTGGPWYTDNELDTEFIKLLCSACLRFIRDRSTPKTKASEDAPARTQPLFSISAAPSYPTAQQILTFLGKSRITETQLAIEHVESLLNVLVLDGEVEKVPAFGAVMWGNNADEENQDESDGERRGKKRKKKSSDSRKRKRSKRSKETDSESESDEESSPEKKKSKKKRKKSQDSDENESDTDRKRKKKKRKISKSDDESSSDGEASSRTKRKKRKSSKRRDSSESESESESDTSSSDSEDERRRRRSKSRSKSRKQSSSPAPDFSAAMDTDFGGGAYVYRAVKQEKVAFGLAQAPCTRCPTFEFCKVGGPVNPQECVYYGEWLGAAVVARE
ncbi:hypothetical protein CERSUDRAFT_155527 [Gelatoporia subvermispora B]|uniref:RNA polymerase III subunit C6 n=1 Tax=Ceriporiopsis subvermispora (strain B) TaxID=914234 RepID=M2RE28_CERS8|nr:hypothetical protein CERSUDRAFT_155527 [Gelatoporia subvermispora B]